MTLKSQNASQAVRLAQFASAAVAGLLLTSCGGETPPAQAPPTPEVRIVVAESQPIANLVEVPGRLEAVRTAEVRARVNGIVERRLYDEGTTSAPGKQCSSSILARCGPSWVRCRPR